MAHFQRERNGALFRVHAVVCSKVLDTADIVRKAIYRQLGSLRPREAAPTVIAAMKTARDTLERLLKAVDVFLRKRHVLHDYNIPRKFVDGTTKLHGSR
jgi:hypothetical protein